MRLNFVVEGQTEETFVNTVLKEHLAAYNVWTSVHCITTNPRLGRRGRGGISSYMDLQRDLVNWTRQEKGNQDVRFTTMVDLYRLPATFPEIENSRKIRDPYERVQFLENALAEDISDHRFIPYLQLYEFETLLLSDPSQLLTLFPNRQDAIARLIQLAQDRNPELINDGLETAPSKRIIREIPEYEGRKQSAAPLTTAAIGLAHLRRRCAHFADWLSRLEQLAYSPA